MIGNRWPHKPPLGYRIDFEQTLAQGLVGFWALNEGCGVPSEAVGNSLATSNSASWTATPSGPGLQFNGTSSYVNLGAPANLNITGRLTIAAFAAPSATAGQQNLLDVRDAPSGYLHGYVFEVNANGNNEIDFSVSGGGSSAASTASAVDGGWHVLAVSMASTATGGVVFYRDGIPWGTGSQTAYPTAPATGTRAIGARSDGAAKWMKGSIGWVGVWNRALAANEHAALARNAWQIFQPRRAEAYFGLIAATPPIYSVTGPNHGIVGRASSNFTITPNHSTTDTITFSDGGAGGTFTPSSLAFSGLSAAQTFTYTPATTGTLSIALTSGHTYQIAPSSLGYTSSPVPANFTLAAPSSAVAGVPSTYTVTPASAATDTITFSDGGAGGTFTPSSLTFSASNAAQTFTYTPVGPSGTATVTPTSADGGLFTPGSITVAVSVVNFTLTGPTTGSPGVASSAFTLTPAGATTDTITFSDGAGGTFTPSSLAFNNSSTAQTFTYTPAKVGPKILTLTSADRAAIAGSPAAFLPLPTPGSIRFTNQCYYQTNSNGLLNARSSATVMYTVQFNTTAGCGASAGVPVITQGAQPNGLLHLPASSSQLGNFLTELYGASSSSISAYVPVLTGIPYHVVISWTSGIQTIFVDGVPVATSALSYATGSYSGILSIGPQAAGPVDVQVSNVAIWAGFAASQADVVNLWTGYYNPLTLVGSATGSLARASAWFPMGGTTGAQPTPGDLALQDWTGNGNNLATALGTASNAAYTGALGYAPLLETSAYVFKSGKVAGFFPVATVPSANGYYSPQQVISCSGLTGIKWKGSTIQADGPVWSSTRFYYPFVTYRLQCGSVQSIGIVNGGTTPYTSPTVAWNHDGGGTSLVPGTPVTDTGVIAYTVTPSTGWTSAPSLSQSGGTYTIGPTATVAFNSTTGVVTVVPIVGGLIGCGSGVTVAPTFTLSGGNQSATVSTTVGKYIKSVPVTSSSSDFTSQPTFAITDSTGAGAILTPVMSGVAEGDALTYTAPMGWMIAAAYQKSMSSGGVAGPTIGGVLPSPKPGAGSPDAIVNYAGSVEGPAGLLSGFPTARTMQLGLNMGASATAPSSPNSPMRNYAKKASGGWSINSGTVKTLFDGTPYSWSPASGTIYTTFYQGSDANPVDNMRTPMLVGTYSAVFTDLGPANSPSKSATTVKFGVLAGAGVGTATAGTTTTTNGVTTVTYTVAYATNPTSWDLELAVLVSHPDGNWYLQDFTIIPPTMSSPANAIAEAPALAGDQNVVNWLTTSRSQSPATLRFMDSMNSYGGTSNVVDVQDILPASAFAWATAGGIPWGTLPDGQPPGSTTDALGNPNLSGRIIFTGFQCFNTDPSKGPTAQGGDGTYGDVSQNFYSEQWGLSGTDSFGPYLRLPATDNGAFMFGATNNPQQTLALELVSSAPHGLRSGQIVNFALPPGAITIPIVGMGGAVWTSNGVYESGGYVTGPNKVLFPVYVNGPGTTIQRVNSGTFVPFTNYTSTPIYATIQQPYGPSVPVEFVASFGSQVGSDPWVNIPPWASLAASAEMARRFFANLTPGRKCYLEWGNEVWNTQFAGYYYCLFAGSLLKDLPPGTKIGSYFTCDGSTTLNWNKFFTVWSGTHHDIWDAAATAAGFPAGTVVRLLGASFGQPTTTSTNLGYATQYGVPVNAVPVAPYYYMYGDPPVQNAFQPAGAQVPAGAGAAAAGNWPMDAILDTIKHGMFYYPYYWQLYGWHAASVAAGNGQPNFPAVVAGGSAGGTLAGGYYYAFYTFVDSSGRETTVGNSQSAPVSIPAGYQLVATLPVVPAGFASLNLYLTPPNSPPGTEVLYQSGITATTVDCTTAVPTSGGTPPPATNRVPQPRGVPKLISYETGPSSLLPYDLTRVNRLTRDAFYHPSIYDTMTAMFAALQTGNPAAPGSGLALANYFELCNAWTDEGGANGVYAMAVTTAQQPGYGLSNQFATAQGGAPADNRAHDRYNQVPILQAARDWWDAMAPPSPTITATSPAVNAIGVPVANPVVATFNQAIRPGTLDFTVSPTSGGPGVGGTVSLDSTETIATFVPTSPFGYDTSYTASIEATGVDGVPIASPYTWSWTTSVIPPAFTGGIPAVSFTFASPIIATGLTITATVDGSNFPGTISYNSSTNVAIFTPTVPFTPGTKYILLISGATATDGTPMAPQTIAFTPSATASGKGWFGGLGRPVMRAGS